MDPTEIAGRARARAARTARALSPHLPYLPFVALSAWVFVLLGRLFVARLDYPLDLEWMEGGVLTHALRLVRGEPLYAPPSVDFVSFLYTPLYPAVLAALSKVFGLSYALGRSVSVLAFSGALLVLVAAVRAVGRERGGAEAARAATAAGLLGVAAVCCAFPFCGAFYDLVRADSLWLLLVAAGAFCCAPGGSTRRVVLGGLLLALGFLAKQTAAPLMVAAAASVAWTSGLRLGLVFSVAAFGSTAAAVLVGQWLTEGWLWIYIYRLHQSHETLVERIWPETPRVLLEHGFVLLLPVAAWLLLAVRRRRLSPLVVHWGLMAAAGIATSSVASATQGAFDNAYVPAVYFVALVSAACVAEAASLAGGPRQTSVRAVAVAGLLVLSTHVAIRWLDPSPHVPSRQDRAVAGRFLDWLGEQGPDVFVPAHPFYNVLAGGRGHLHVMGVSDAWAWARTITSDPARDRAIKDRFRESVAESLASGRWALVLQDDCPTPRLFGLQTHYRLVEDLASSGRAPRTLTGYPCTLRSVWAPRLTPGPRPGPP